MFTHPCPVYPTGSMAASFRDRGLQSTFPRQPLLLIILVSAIACKSVTSSPTDHLNPQSLLPGSTHPQEREETIATEEAPATTRAAGEQRQGRRQAEELLGGRGFELQREVSEGRTMASAAAGHPTVKTWPGLVGLDVEEAKKKILEEHPGMQVQIVGEGGIMTMDFNLRRVRIHKNKEGKVAQIPKAG